MGINDDELESEILWIIVFYLGYDRIKDKLQNLLKFDIIKPLIYRFKNNKNPEK